MDSNQDQGRSQPKILSFIKNAKNKFYKINYRHDNSKNIYL